MPLPETLPLGERGERTAEEGHPASVISVRGAGAYLDTQALTPSGATHLARSTQAGEARASASSLGRSALGALLPDRYEDLSCIAAGGFGEVWRVRDRALHRTLAMKILRGDLVHSQHVRARFLTEARITAQLQHPGIVAVHDEGELADGRLWFTMKEVRGRTLRAVIDEVHEAAGADAFVEAPSGWTFRRLLDAFARISQAVAFAHSRGVMHRDLKPDNLMVGEFGEVLVMDWGLARRVDVDTDSLPGLISVDLPAEAMGLPAGALVGRDGVLPILGDFDSPEIRHASTGGPDSATAELTRYGDVLGTPAYMPPEQACGQRELHGPHSDVYALGAILYHLLSGRAPYSGTSHAVLRMVIEGPPPPLSQVLLVRPPVPEELVQICERAMRREIRERYPGAEPLSADILAFLEGARRREQALGVLDQARAIEPELAGLRTRAAQAREEAQALLGEVQPYDPIEKKRAGWALEDEAAALGRVAALRETEWVQAVHGALLIHPELPEAHALLADHYRERLSTAELAHQDEDAARFEAQLRAHDRGRHAAFLRGEGALSLVTDPPGAEVWLERYELRDRRLVPVDMGLLGMTPLRALPIQRGSYRLRLRAPGRAEVFYPVLIERGAHWDGCAPGEDAPYPIVLPLVGELGPDDCYVPAGWCWTGGDPEAGDSLPLQRVWIDGFVVRRFPVTIEEYVAFLNALVVKGQEAKAVAVSPKSEMSGGDGTGEHLVLRRDAAGHFLPEGVLQGRLQQPDWPVVLVDWHAGTAYAEWLAEITGQPWRLPHELEREKAARGVDARRCPWGDHFDATFACVAESDRAELTLAAVTSYALDRSPYEVRGLAGNSRDWCVNPWRHNGPRVEGRRVVADPASEDDPSFRSVRGGAWTSPMHFGRSACRFASRPEVQRVSVGLRVARPLRAACSCSSSR